MKWLHGFNLYSLVVLGGFTAFVAGLGTAAARYRSWAKRHDPQQR